MAGKKLKIVIWCGAAPNQRALVHKMAAQFNVAGIVTDMHTGGGRKKKFLQLPALIWDHLRFREIYEAWWSLMEFYDKHFPDWPDIPRIEVNNINSTDTVEFVKKMQPDLVVVSGTALIKEPLLSIPLSTGIINLHTGLSPYVKGGPNCTNWCIANNDFHLVGNTIMWLNAGIDAGNIITTERIDIVQADNLKKAHIWVMEHAHDLYLRAIEYLEQTDPPYISVPQQQISKGQLFLTKMWTPAKRRDLLRNWRNRHSFVANELPETISLKHDGKN